MVIYNQVATLVGLDALVQEGDRLCGSGLEVCFTILHGTRLLIPPSPFVIVAVVPIARVPRADFPRIKEVGLPMQAERGKHTALG
eukprot:3010740-Prymnesium_polylepis.2